MHMRFPAVMVLSLFAAALPAQAQKINDVLHKKDGSNLRGIEITSMTIATTKYKKGNEALELAGYQVAGVDWSSPGDAFTSAQAAMKRHDYENAKQLFGEAANTIERPVVKADAKFLQCRAAVAAADNNPSTAPDAAGALRAWIGENADNWRLPEAMLLLGRAQRLAKLGADAVTTLQELDDRATREAWGPVWNARAKFEMALALLDQGKGAEARSSFQGAASAIDSALAQPSPDQEELRALQTNAKVGEGETYIADKDYAQALAFFGQLDSSGNGALAAAAKAGEGQALYLQAADSKDPAALRRAQVALATASVLDASSGETSAKANYFLGLCLLALGPEHEGDTCKARANAYFQIVTRSYPSSRWSAAAQAELAK